MAPCQGYGNMTLTLLSPLSSSNNDSHSPTQQQFHSTPERDTLPLASPDLVPIAAPSTQRIHVPDTHPPAETDQSGNDSLIAEPMSLFNSLTSSLSSESLSSLPDLDNFLPFDLTNAHHHQATPTSPEIPLTPHPENSPPHSSPQGHSQMEDSIILMHTLLI